MKKVLLVFTAFCGTIAAFLFLPEDGEYSNPIFYPIKWTKIFIDKPDITYREYAHLMAGFWSELSADTKAQQMFDGFQRADLFKENGKELYNFIAAYCEKKNNKFNKLPNWEQSIIVINILYYTKDCREGEIQLHDVKN